MSPTAFSRTMLVNSFALLASLPSAQGLVDTARRYLHPVAGSFHYLADLDGDGDDDALWFQDGEPGFTDTVGFRAFWNDGGELGQPGPQVSFPGGWFSPLNGLGLRRLADVTGDGLVDVVVASTEPAFGGSSTLHVYPAVHPGVFGAPLSMPQRGAIRGATLGNVDADAAREIAVVEYVIYAGRSRRDEVVAWYDWDGAAFTRSESVAERVAWEPTVLAGLDLEGDGDTDLVWGLTDAQALRLSLTSGGAPGPMSSVTLPLIWPGRLAPYACDLEGGGPEDLLVVARYGSRNFALLALLNQAGSLVAQAEQTFAASFDYVDPSHFRTGDWDADGDEDVLYYGWPGPGGAVEGNVAFFENDDANGFGDQPVAVAKNYDPPLSELEPGTPLEASDLDGDGRLDFVMPRSVQFGRGRFESSLLPITGFSGHVPIGHFDHEGDGDLDLFLTDVAALDDGWVAVNDGTGAFAERVFPPPAPPGRERLGIAGIGDFSGDGRVDFLAGIWVPPGAPFWIPAFEEIRLYANDGLGGFRDEGRASGENFLTTDRRTNLAHDMDGDGDVDLLGRASGGGYWPNRGRGTFAEFEPLFPGCCNVPSAVGDLDADGGTDVVTASLSPQTLIAWVRRGPAGRARRVESRTPAFDPVFQANLGGIEADSVTLADQDLDGDLDLALTTGPAQEIRLFVNDGAAAFGPGAVLSTDLVSGPESWMSFLAFEDLDGDGNVELLGGADYSSSLARSVLVFRGLGGGAFSAARPFAGAIMAAPGDLDGDGDLDLPGQALVRSLRFDGPADGGIRQYGAGTAGSGGAVPVLGARGPLRLGASGAELRLRRARGAAPLALFYSFSSGTGPAVPFAGAPTLLGAPIHSDLFTALGAAGQAGAGRLDLDLGPELAALAGLTLFFQASVLDPAASGGFALSNGLELTFGF